MVFCKNCAFSTAKLNEKAIISRHKTAITSIFSSTVSVPVEPVPRKSLYCTTWYHPEAGTAPPAPVRTSTVLLGARTGRKPVCNYVLLWLFVTFCYPLVAIVYPLYSYIIRISQL